MRLVKPTFWTVALCALGSVLGTAAEAQDEQAARMTAALREMNLRIDPVAPKQIADQRHAALRRKTIEAGARHRVDDRDDGRERIGAIDLRLFVPDAHRRML